MHRLSSIYITWACQVLSALISNKFWYLYLAVPGIGIFKLYTTFAPMIKQFRGQGSSTPNTAPVPADVAAGQPQESKRQAKLKARMERGDKRVQQKEIRRAA